MTELKNRSVRLANELARSGAAKFLSSGRAEKFGKEGIEYEALFVRRDGKDRLLRLLSVVDETTSDIALILDVVLAQEHVIAEQAMQIARLREDIETVRTERLAVDVTRQVNDALLQAGREGVCIEKFEFEIGTRDALAEESEGSLVQKDSDASEASRSWSISGALGSVLDKLKGAHLAGDDAKKTFEKIQSLLDQGSKIRRTASRRMTGRLAVARVGPPQKDA